MVHQTADYKAFFEKEAPALLSQLKPDQKAVFGIMTPQHMVEHLVKTVKTSIKSYGDVPESPTEQHLRMKKFIFSNAEFPPTDPSKARLDELRFGSIAEALNELKEAVQRFYAYFDENPEAQPYNSFFGALSREELERFHYKHILHHLKQFELIN